MSNNSMGADHFSGNDNHEAVKEARSVGIMSNDSMGADHFSGNDNHEAVKEARSVGVMGNDSMGADHFSGNDKEATTDGQTTNKCSPPRLRFGIVF